MKKILVFIACILLFVTLLISCGDKCTVTFDTVGGSEVEVQKVGNGGKATEPTAPTKAGYTFDGWYLGNEKWSFVGYTVTDDMTLTAKWSLNTYSVTYTGLPNGATHTNPTTYTVESDCFKDGMVTLSEPTVPLGYTFNGWYDANDNKITELPLENTTVRADFTLLYKDLPKLNYTVNPDGKTITVTGVKDKNITSIEIPDIVTSIDDYAFLICSSLTNITINENNTAYKSIDGNLYAKDGKTLIQYAKGKTAENFVIPDSVTSLGERAFQYCSSLTSVTIPDSVESIGEWAFSWCHSLTSVTIGNSVTSIGDSAFYDCSSLTNVTIGNSVTIIGYEAFYDCSSLTSVTIPDSVTSIGDSAFSGCSSLTSVTIPDSVESIGNSAFRSCSSLTSVTIPDSVTSIGERAFRNCSSLTSVTIPDSVTSIGEQAFSYCSSLTSVTIPDSVTSIGNHAFSYCSALTSIKYRGTEQQWKNISKGNIGYNGTVTYNYTGQ